MFFDKEKKDQSKATVLRGLLELFVMNECRDWASPKSILEKIKIETNDNWTPNLAAFYSTFRKFERKKITNARLSTIGDKKIIEYKLTKKGEEELLKRKNELREGVKKNAFVMIRITSYILCDNRNKRNKLMDGIIKELGEAYE